MIDWEKLLVWTCMLIISVLFWVGVYYAAALCYRIIIELGT